MKKLILCLLCVMSSLLTWAQSYQCVRPGEKRYFTNHGGYLRGMRIDSVRTVGADIIYYPFHTMRGYYGPLASWPSNYSGASWFGSKIIQRPDGTFLFNTLWNDTVVIKTQVHTGDSWIFYNDTTSLYYKASLIAEDTLSIGGALDSVKTIRINAYDTSGIVATDPVNGFQLMLSKNNGFYQAIDLYTFPYHAPDSAYMNGYDLFLDCVTDWFSVSAYNSVFTLIIPENFTMADLYNWNPGDVLQYSICNTGHPGNCIYPYQYCFDSITAKTITVDSVIINFSGLLSTQFYQFVYFVDHEYPYITRSFSSVMAMKNSLILDTTRMPEEYNQPQLIFYYPRDSGSCVSSCVYTFVDPPIYDSTVLVPLLESSLYSHTYKPGLGLVHWYGGYPGGAPPLTDDTTLRYYRIGSTICGGYTVPWPYLTVADPILPGHFSLFPNPASDELTITTTINEPYTLTFVDAIGQIIKAESVRKPQTTINVAALPPGLYNAVLTTAKGDRITQKLTILH